MKRYFMISVSFVLLVGFVLLSCIGCAYADDVKVEQITFDKDVVIVQVGKSEKVKVTLTPKKPTNKNIEWSSSDESVATVSKGKVYGVAEGETVITAKAADGNGATAELKVTVVVPVKKITVQEKAVVLAEDTTWKLDYIVEPVEATINTVEWTSSNDNVASIDENGLITGHKIGKCEVIGTAKDASKVKVKIKVQVKDFDYVLRKPENLQTDLNLSNAYQTSEISFGGFYSRSVYERYVSYGNNVVGDAGSNQIRPLKAGEGTIECIGKDNGRVTEKWKKTVYVSQTAAPIENDDEIGRMEAESYEGHTYQVFYSGRSWDDAEAFCEKHGGHLVTITGDKEQKFLERYLAKAEKKQSYWIGLNSGKTKGFSKWITGEPITYTKWSEGNPDGNEPSYNCGRIAASEYADENNWTMKRGTWDDVDGNYYQINGFICEWDEDNSSNALPVAEKTTVNNTAGDNAEAETSILIESGEESRYGQKLTLNSGKDTERTFIGYFLPAGTYEVLNQGNDKATKVLLYENVKQIIKGSEEYKESANGKSLMLLPGKSGNLTVGDNEFVLPSAEEFSLLFERQKTVSLKDMGIPEDAKVNDGHAYKVIDFTATWNDAKNKCESFGGHLATITSQEEQHFIEAMTSNRGEFWIGMYRVDDDSFAWVTGEPVSYTNWGAGEPNNYWTWEYDGENAVAMRPDWNDYHENNTEYIKGFVCEWDLDAETAKIIDKSEEANSFEVNTSRLKDADSIGITEAEEKGDQKKEATLVNENVSDEKAILFRGIPWGANISSYEKAFEGQHVSKNDNEYLIRWSNRKSELDPNSVNLNNMYGDGYPAGWGTLIFSMDRENGFKVSGYHVSTVLGLFAYGIDNEGDVLRDEKDSRFYMAEYGFDAEDGINAYDDLKQKLTDLYGTGTETSEKSRMLTVDENSSAVYVDTVVTKYLIKDAVGICMLEKVETEKDCASLSLVYADINSDQIIDEVLRAIKHEKLINESVDSLDNYNGL